MFGGAFVIYEKAAQQKKGPSVVTRVVDKIEGLNLPAMMLLECQTERRCGQS